MFLALVFGFALALVFVPGIRRHLAGLFPSASRPRMNPAVVVWADRMAGNYYCAGSRLYGRQPGTYMKQGQALTFGFQPDLGQYCEESQTTDSSRLNHTKNGHAPNARFSSTQPLSELPSKK